MTAPLDTLPSTAADPALDRPFTSFFAKPHQRAAALDPARRTGRTRPLAFGQPVPEPIERSFALPRDFLTPAAIRASARSRRLQRRTTTGTANGGGSSGGA